MKKLLLIIFIFVYTFSFSETTVNQKHKSTYRELSRENYTIEKMNQLLILYTDSIDINPNLTEDSRLAFYKLATSKLYYKLGNYNNSIKYGEQALENYRILKDTFFIMSSLVNMGATYGEIGEKEIALDYFKQIEKLAIASKASKVLAYNYINLGISYSYTNKTKALEYYKKAKETIGTDKNDFFDLYLLINKSSIYFDQAHYITAKNSYLTAFKLISETHSFYASMCTNIAQTYLKLKQADSALYYCRLALKPDIKHHSTNDFANTYSVMTDAYISLNKPDSVKFYLELFKSYKDSIIISKKDEYISKLKVVYETDNLIENIRIQKEELEASHKRIINMAIALLLFTIALIVSFIYYKKLQLSYKNIVKESVKAIKMEKEFMLLKQKTESTVESKININIENSDEIFNEIIRLLDEEKLFTDEDFDVNKLSERLNTNRTYISKIINSKTNDSFVKFVNSYRIKEVQRMLLDEGNNHLTLNAIGKEAGFKSPATFYRVFKAETGVTPSFFIKNKNL